MRKIIHALAASVFVIVVAPSREASAQQYCNLQMTTPACASSNASGLNTCREARRCDAKNLTDIDRLGGPNYQGPVPQNRYDYAWCEGAKSCSAYDCDPETGELVRNPNCNPKIVADHQKEAETSCTTLNYGVRQLAETCRDAIANSFISAGAPKLEAGNPGKLYTWTNDDPGGDPCARVESSTTKDMGIGKWHQNTLTIPAYDPRNPPATDPSLFLFERIVNPELRFERSQAMSFTTGTATHTWDEVFSTRRNYRQHIWTYGSLRGMGDATQYTMADPPKPLPQVVATFCGSNRASVFVQGYNNPTGGGATATAANIDVTSSGGNPTSTIRQLLADTVNVVELLRGNKRVSDCNAMFDKWSSCSGLPDGTYSHSMGAIATNVWGLTTSLTIGSVDNVGWWSPSLKNNCDVIPEVTQLGLELLQQFPTASDATLYPCTEGNQSDCVIAATQGEPARWTTMQDPHETNCAGDSCYVKWCSGRPGPPRDQIWSGRGTLQDQLSATVSDKCVNFTNELTKLTTKCSFKTNPLTTYLNCIDPILTTIDGLLNGVADHVLGGHASVKYNGYQVVSGLDNLGRVTQRPPVTGIFIQNPPPTAEPPGKALKCAVIDVPMPW